MLDFFIDVTLSCITPGPSSLPRPARQQTGLMGKEGIKRGRCVKVGKEKWKDGREERGELEEEGKDVQNIVYEILKHLIKY